MAGGVLKGFGGVFLAIGLLLVLLGIAAAAYGATQEDQNQEEFLPDAEESDENQALLHGGAAAAAIGLVLTIIAIILLASGGARGRNAMERATRESGAATGENSSAASWRLPSPTVDRRDGEVAGAGEQAADKPKPRTAKTTPARIAGRDVAGKASGAGIAPEASDSLSVVPAGWAVGEQRRSGSRGFIAVAVVLAIVVGAVLLLMSAGVVETDGGGVFGARNDKELLNETYPGSLSNTAYFPPFYEDPPETGTFHAPAGTNRCTVTLTWAVAQNGGASNLYIALSDEEETILGARSGTSPLEIELTKKGLGGHDITYSVRPNTTGTVVSRQDFQVQVVCIG